MPNESVSCRIISDLIKSLSVIAHGQTSNENGSASPVLPVDLRQSINCLCRIAENLLLPDSLFEALASHPSWEVRAALCDNQGLPVALIQQLAQDQHPDVRYAIAENHNMPLKVLAALCDDQNPYVSARAGRTLSRVRHCYGFCFKNNAADLERTMEFNQSRLQNAV